MYVYSEDQRGNMLATLQRSLFFFLSTVMLNGPTHHETEDLVLFCATLWCLTFPNFSSKKKKKVEKMDNSLLHCIDNGCTQLCEIWDANYL